MLKVDDILKQLDAIMRRHGDLPLRDPADRSIVALLTSAEAAIERFALPSSPYGVRCQQALAQESSDSYKLERLIGIVDALRQDYGTGGLTPVQDLIRAEVFDEFLDAAQHLLD